MIRLTSKRTGLGRLFTTALFKEAIPTLLAGRVGRRGTSWLTEISC